MDKFEIGEVALFKGPMHEISESIHSYIGEEVIIQGGLKKHPTKDNVMRHPVTALDGCGFMAYIKHLHKKKPPKEDDTDTQEKDKPLMGTWEDVKEFTGWSPVKLPEVTHE